jgi:gamma-glutamylcyclotransferase (GGCT)/AIG2-like uncharacterized protein YtfP
VPIRVFVYGTLKKGHGNHRLLAQSKFLGRCVLHGKHRLVSLGGFPGLVATPNDEADRPVSGEVYQVTEEVLQSLDFLEGHPRFYERQKLSTPYKNAWAYYLPESYLSKGYPECQLTWSPTPDERKYLDEEIKSG